MTAASYARYSSDQQRESSIVDQERNCDRAAAREGETIAHRYRDQAISGSRTDRPDYQRMLTDAKAGRFKTLYCDDAYRLGRDDIELKQAVQQMSFWGVRIISVDGFDSEKEGAELDIGVRGLIGSIYLVDLKKKTHRGLTGQALKGNNCGGRPYGYRSVPIEHPTQTDQHGRPKIDAVRLEIDPEQADVVRWIFEQYANGKPYKRIASELNRNRVPSPRGSTWSFSAVYGHRKKGTGILNNEIYLGEKVWNKSKWIKEPVPPRKRKRIERPESEWIRVTLPELQIVSRELWDRVKARQRETELKHADHGRPGRMPKYLLSGFLRCQCGSRFVMINRHRYGCASHRNRGADVCDNRLTVARAIAEDRILEAIKEDMLAPAAVELFRQEITRAMAEQRKQADPGKAQRQLKKVENEIDNIMAAIKAGIFTETTKAELEKAEAERKRLRAETAEPAGRDSIATMIPGVVDAYREIVASLGDNIEPENMPEARQHLQALLGDEITLTPSKEGYLNARLAGDYAGLLKMVGDRGSINVVAGAGFCTYRTVALK